MAAEEENDKKKREKNIIVYGISEEVQLSDCSREFLDLAEVLQFKPEIVDVSRLGIVQADGKPRPLLVN